MTAGEMTSNVISLAHHTIENIKNRTAYVGVVGLGYVGLPFWSRRPRLALERWA